MNTPERRTDANRPSTTHDLDHPGSTDQRPVVNLVNLVLSEALLAGATAARLAAPEGKGVPILFQVGNDWKPVMKVPLPAASPMVNRLKVMAALRIDRQSEQRGTIRVRLRGQEFDLALTVRAGGGAEEAELTIPPTAFASPPPGS